MPRMELSERIKALIAGLERAVEAWRKEGSVVFGIYAQLNEDEIPQLRDLLAYPDAQKRDSIKFMVKRLQDKAVTVAQGRAMDDMEVSERAEYVQLKRLAAQVENLLNKLPVGR
jgi:hypothetical protein